VYVCVSSCGCLGVCHAHKFVHFSVGNFDCFAAKFCWQVWHRKDCTCYL